MRMLFAGGGKGRLCKIIKERIERSECNALVMFERAVARGELPESTDLQLVRDLLLGSAQNLILFRNDACTDETIERVIDLMLLGAAAGGRRKKPARR